jgi:hypothetical protein
MKRLNAMALVPPRALMVHQASFSPGPGGAALANEQRQPGWQVPAIGRSPEQRRSHKHFLVAISQPCAQFVNRVASRAPSAGVGREAEHQKAPPRDAALGQRSDDSSDVPRLPVRGRARNPRPCRSSAAAPTGREHLRARKSLRTHVQRASLLPSRARPASRRALRLRGHDERAPMHSPRFRSQGRARSRPETAHRRRLDD